MESPAIETSYRAEALVENSCALGQKYGTFMMHIFVKREFISYRELYAVSLAEVFGRIGGVLGLFHYLSHPRRRDRLPTIKGSA